MALQFAHVGDFFLGYSHMLRDRVARVLPHWNRKVAGYGFIQGMYAFGLEEVGEYEQAEEHGREAVALNKQDGWAVHAVAHVMEMQGRAKEGVDFLAAGAGGWAPNSVFAYHLWWHKALFHIDANDVGAALKLYDEKISAGGFGQALELLDGSALLWRLSLFGHDVGDRWKDLADKWEARVDHAYYAFNDVQRDDGVRRRRAQRCAEAVDRGGEACGCRPGHERDDEPRGRRAGVRRLRGVRARRLRARRSSLLSPVRGKANRFGGSHAQRDMFSWTLTEAAIRLATGRSPMRSSPSACRGNPKARSIAPGRCGRKTDAEAGGSSATFCSARTHILRERVTAGKVDQ